ncbi:MAG: hypothetical protein A2599_03310 [Candidatus Staskawiczbacteria bacterium RIFOXYD1_FULL_39_28]|nr:MAG: hypothetical protein A2599_03310 [Candidatus Staskawiczbacteria bacterium RIFOXYD1_FULL_39_28]
MNQLGDGLETAGYTPEEVTKLRSPEVLSQFKLVLIGLATIVRACFKLALDKAFNPSEFVGSGWTVWKGPADGTGLEGDEDCVAEPAVVDFERIALETHLQESDNGSVHGEEKMRRARASKNRQLGGRTFLGLWNDWLVCKAAGKPEDSILEHLRRAGKIGTVVYFFGLVLRDPYGRRCVLCLGFDGGRWYWDCRWLGRHLFFSDGPSVSLASVFVKSSGL